MNKYTPNFDNARVRRKCLHAIGWASACLSEKPRDWAKLELDKHFGTQNHDLSRYLRHKLLTVADHFYDPQKGQAKKYTLNQEGYDFLVDVYKEHLPHTKSLHCVAQQHRGVEWAKAQYGEQIASGEFEYEHKTHRDWNPLQQLPTQTRAPLFAHYGYTYEYDIKSAAATLIQQRAQQANTQRRLAQPRIKALHTPTLDDYLAHKDHYRQALGERLYTDADSAKQILTALMAGARLSPQGQIREKYLESDGQLRTLQSMKWIEDLRQDIKNCWREIKLQDELEYTLTSRTKWHKYFELEHQVMREIKKYLRELDVTAFYEHDGWRCTRFIDPQQIETRVRTRCGYRIELEYTQVKSLTGGD